jgi:DEAD/DEAH box helicase domain-containing protein
MAIETVLHALRGNSDFISQVAAWERLPPRPARHAPVPDLLPSLAQALAGQGIGPLYTHQAAAIAATRRGEHVVLATGTASGKSLAYALPVLEELARDPEARALWLFPTRALTQDQLAATRDLITSADLPIEAHVFDGDTPRSQRSRIRRNARLLLTNPDMLHAGILPFHTGWRDFFANLRVIVIDEIHACRGIFGSHVANLLRRLLRLCAFYGSRPRFICCSATIANPREHAERLCGVPFTLIGPEQDGAPHGEKHVILYNPPVIDEALGLRQSLLLSAMDGAVVFLQERVQTVVFGRSRQSVELLLGYIRDRLAADGWDEVERRIAGYRGGYLPLERRTIEHGMRSGMVQGIVATNALELGIDIGALDAAILAGYPGSIASVWQQAGRAGRREGVSAVLLMMGNSALEQYICKQPRWLFGRSAENALINPDNPRILLNHIQCAAAELPFDPDELWGSFGPVTPALDVLEEEGQLHNAGGRRHWIGDGQPAHTFSLRTGGNETVVIQQAAQAGRDPITLGEVDPERAVTTVHEEAIYLHAGEAYFVEQLDWEARIALVRPVEVDYYTRASVSSEIRALESAETVLERDVLHAHGDLRVVSQATGFRKIRRYTHETLGTGTIDLPPWELETTGYWLVVGEALTEQLVAAGVLQRPNDYGPSWAAQRQQALARDGHRCQVCGVSADLLTLHVHHLRPFREFGYERGHNNHDRLANRLENLATLCPACHRRAEAAVQTHSAMSGLAWVLRHLAPLFLMCDVDDIQVTAQTLNPVTAAPTLVIYERTAAGVGFSQKLYQLRHTLLAAARELIGGCGCRDGCPACVGPPGETGPDTKAVTLRLLGELVIGK